MTICAVQADELIYAADDIIEIDDGIWDEQPRRPGQWLWEVEPTEYLRLLYLEHGVGPDGAPPPDEDSAD
jgi:hypothetical protein